MINHIIEAANYGRSFSEHPIYRHGAVIMPKKGPRVRYYGSNVAKTTPGSPKPYKTICAEFDAVLRACRESVRDFSGYVMYVGRYRRDGKMGNSKPCEWCTRMITKLGFKKIYYSTDTGHETL